MTKRNIVDCLRTGKAPSAQGRVGTVAEQRQRAANYIEELEAKLAAAEIIIRIIASDKWDERLGEAVDLSCEYLAELKGETDE